MLLPSLIAYRASFLVAVGWHMQLSHALGAVFLRCGDHRRLPLLGHAAARVGERGVGIAQRSISSTASRWHALTARFDLLNVSTRLGAVEPDGTKENGIRLKIRCQIAQSGGPSPRARLAACVSSKPPQRPRPVIPIRRGFLSPTRHAIGTVWIPMDMRSTRDVDNRRICARRAQMGWPIPWQAQG